MRVDVVHVQEERRAQLLQYGQEFPVDLRSVGDVAVTQVAHVEQTGETLVEAELGADPLVGADPEGLEAAIP